MSIKKYVYIILFYFILYIHACLHDPTKKKFTNPSVTFFSIRSSNTSTKDSKSKSYPFCASNRPMKPE